MTGGVLGLLGPGSLAFVQTAASSKKLPIAMAGYRYDRVAALVDGRVRVEGCDVRFETAAIGDMNTDVFSGPQTRDVTEIGLHPFMQMGKVFGHARAQRTAAT